MTRGLRDAPVALACLLSLTAYAQTYSKTETIEYYDDRDTWVIGQVARSRINGVEVVRTTYDPTYAVPMRIYRFGELEQTMSYDTSSAVSTGQRGTLRTVSDGRDSGTYNTTVTFTSWKRGVPRRIGYPATPDQPSGESQTATVNDNGTIASITDENGYTTSYTYDEMGRLASINYPDETDLTYNNTSISFGPVGSSEYGIAAGHWRRVADTGYGRTITYYDALWRPLVESRFDRQNVTATRSTTVRRYDGLGRLAFQSYPRSSISGYGDAGLLGTATRYDALGRVTLVEQDSELGFPLRAVTQYLPDFETKVTNPRNQVTTTRYMTWDEPTYDYPVAIVQPEGVYTDIARDVFGKPTALTRRNATSSVALTRQYVYDAQQRLCKAIEPESGVTMLDYDAAGNLWWSASGLSLSASTCDRGSVASSQRVVRSYDQRNRLLSLVFPDGNGDQQWRYTADGLPGQVTTWNDGSSVVNTYAYNKRRLLTRETQTQLGMPMWTLGYSYDANGALTSISYPGGDAVAYAPNALGQPTRAGSYATGVSYFPNGGMRQFTYGNGVVHTLTQNVRGLPERSRDTGTRVVLDDSYDYDQNGNVLAITDGVGGARGDRDMSYDGLDRLTHVSASMFGAGGANYSYDALGNLTHVEIRTRDHYYCYDSDWRLTNIKNGGCSGATVMGLGYDNRGNLSNKNGVGYNFDYGNRLRAVAGRESYRYDAYGRRVAATSDPAAAALGTIYSVYGQDGVLRYQRDERQGKEINYVTLNGSLVAGVSYPIAPTSVGLSVPATSNTGSYTVSWSSAGSATSYILQEKVGSTWSTIQASAATGRDITGKANGTYSYRAQACSDAGCSDWSNEGTIVVTHPPAEVPTLTAPSTSTGSFTVTWTASGGATGYTLEERIDGGAWSESYAGPERNRAYAGKPVGLYDYRVKACNVGGCTDYSVIASVEVQLAPTGTPVVTVAATNHTGSYPVTWTSVDGADTYDLQEHAGSAWVTVHSAGTTSISVTGKASGAYVYRARACMDGACGPWGNEATIEVELPPTEVPTLTVPSRSTTGTYAVDWTASAEAETYHLEENLNGGAWQPSYDGASLSKSYSGKAAGIYSYRIKACNTGGCTAASASESIEVIEAPDAAPAITLPASNNTGGYTVSWSAVSTATRYPLEERVGSGSWTEIQDLATRNRVFSGKSDGLYSYRVRACNDAGCSGYSEIESITVLTPPTGVPTITAPASNHTGSYVISWTAVSKATSYTLQRSTNNGAWATIPTGSSRSHSVTGQGAGSHRYRVRACNGGGCAAWSAIKTTVVKFAPATPSNLTGRTEVDDSVRPPLLNYYVFWSDTPAATYYELREFNTVVYSGELTNFITWGRTIKTFYVRACNEVGCSAWSGGLQLGE